MSVSKILILAGLAIVLVKFLLSLLGKNDISWLNQLVTVLLGIFIAFEVFQLGQAVWLKAF